jgi:predicted AlkP superfamily pyrophosphatase or phosphodiesterase
LVDFLFFPGTNKMKTHCQTDQREITLLIQLDALRHDYNTPSDAPFLFMLAQQGVSGSLVPTFGFEPDSAYLAGLYPDECDGGAHYWYEPEATPFGFARYVPTFLDHLPYLPKKVFRRLLTEWVRRTTACKYESVANIPLNVLPYVAPVEKHLPHEAAYLEQPTIFSLCDEHDISWLFHASPSCPVRIDAGVERLKCDLKPPIGFAFWHIGDLDTAGHRFGPNSIERKTAMRKVDASIRDVMSELKKRYDQINCVIIGDHGMVEVSDTVNVQERLLDAGVKQNEGILYFLDSPMARFWFFDEGVKSKVLAVLGNIPGGRILTQVDIDHYHLNYAHNRFGDLFFLADPGIMILPNFYQDNDPVKGMHGYAPETPDQQSALVIHSPKVKKSKNFDKPVDMRRVFPTVLDLLELPIPQTTTVTSLLQRS